MLSLLLRVIDVVMFNSVEDFKNLYFWLNLFQLFFAVNASNFGCRGFFATNGATKNANNRLLYHKKIRLRTGRPTLSVPEPLREKD